MAKQHVLGPYSRRVPASSVRAELLEVAQAGCAYVEVHEPAVVGLSASTASAFAAAHEGLLQGLDGVHCSLVITGGNAEHVGVRTLLTAPFASVAFDLIDGPENWRLVAATPGDRGIICGAVSGRPVADQKEVLLWAAEYAASTGARGMARVGLATAGSLSSLPWDRAIQKLSVLGEAVRLAELPPKERAARLDPRSVDIRSAAMGRFDPEGRPQQRRRRT
jgi:hypothetical protein